MNKKELLNRIKTTWAKQDLIQRKCHKKVLELIKDLSKKELEEVYSEELMQLDDSERELKEYS